MKKKIFLLSLLFSMSYSITGFTCTVQDGPITARYSEHLDRYGGLLIESFPLMDWAVSSAIDEILRNPTPRKVRILEVGPGEATSSIIFRSLKNYFENNQNFPETINFEVWFVEPNSKHRERIIADWEAFSKDWFQKFRTKIDGKISKSLGQDFFSGNAFNKLKQSDLRPFELIVSSNVLHFMKPDEQMNFIAGASNAMKPRSHLILLTKGIHENLSQLDIATRNQMSELKQEFDRNLKEGDYFFPGFIPWYFNAYAEKGYTAHMFHSGTTLSNILSIESFSLEVERAEEIMATTEVSLVDSGSILKEIPLVFAIARKK